MNQLKFTTQITNERRPPPSKTDLERMKLIPCNRGDNCENYNRGKCRYSHEGGGRAVQHDRFSHKQLPPRETDEELLKRVLTIQGFSKDTAKYIAKMNSLEFIIALLEMFTSFQGLLSSPPITGLAIADVLRTFHKTCEKFPETLGRTLGRLLKFLQNNIDHFSSEMVSQASQADFKVSIADFLKTFAVPEEVSSILKSHQEAKAMQESKDPVEKARANPNGFPEREFLDHLANACGLSANTGFNEARKAHETLNKTSSYRNSHFLGFLSIHEALKEATKLLKAKELKEIEDHKVDEAHAKLLQECLARNNPLLMIAFRILQAQSEFVKFIQSLSEQDRETLVSVFGSFMSYIAHVCDKKDTQITSEFLSMTFRSFTQSRKVDGSTNAFKTNFFKHVRTDFFDGILKTLHVETTSLHGSRAGKPATQMMVHEVFKFMMKELLDLYEDKVPHDERENFYKGVVKEVLPLAFLISLSPKKSNMLAGRWKKGELDKTTGQPVNHYLKMQDPSEKKSILYWLLMNLNEKRSSKKKQTSEICDTFEKLSSQFTCEREITNSDGSTEKKKIFSPNLLFQALQDVQIRNFLNASEFPIKLQNIEQNSLGTLFCVEGDTISLSDTCPDELLMALYYALGSSERNPHTRQFSDVKALIHMTPECVLKVVKMCQSFDPTKPVESVIAIIESLGFKGDKSLENPLITLLTLISKNESEDLLRRAYDVMSLAITLIEIHNNDSYFMSLVDALVVVLLTEKFPNVKHYSIMQAVYEAKSKPGKHQFINSVWIQNFVDSLDENDARKKRLTEFLSKGTLGNKEEFETMKKKILSLREILCIHGQQDGSFHDQIKRVLPFLLDRNSLVGLLETVPEFEIDSSDFLHSHDYAAFMLRKIKALFEKEITAFIASQNSQIQRDLKARICEIKQISDIADRLKALGFTKHASAIANLVNALFSTLALPYGLDAETFVSRFPKTKGLDQSVSATHVCNHVLSMIGVVKPIEPAKPVEAVEPKKKSKSKESKEEAEYKASVVKFTLAMEKFQTLEDIVSRAISAIYRVEIPKEEGATFEKAPTIQLIGLKNIILQSTTLVDLFGKCLPYWKSPLVRELILSILNHKFQCGDEFVRDLYRQIQSFGVSFEHLERSQYQEMFSFLTNAEAVLQKTDSYEMSDDDMLGQMKESLRTDFWNDSKTEVEISSPVVQRSRKVAIRRRQHENESETSFGGGPAPEQEVPEDDSDPVVVFDVNVLRRLLKTESKDGAIQYMESLSSRDETEEGILELLKSEDSTRDSVLEAVNDVYN